MKKIIFRLFNVSVCVTGKPTNAKWVKWQLEHFDLIHLHINDESGQSVTAWELVAILRNSYSEQVANHKAVWVQSSQAEWEKLSQACEAQTFFFFFPHHESLDSGDFFKAWCDIENGSVPNDTTHQKKNPNLSEDGASKIAPAELLVSFNRPIWAICSSVFCTGTKTKHVKTGSDSCSPWKLNSAQSGWQPGGCPVIEPFTLFIKLSSPRCVNTFEKMFGVFCMRVCMIPLCVCVFA